jgi:hypothetical protein
MKIFITFFLALTAVSLSSCINDSLSSDRLDGPTSAAVGPDGNIYISDGYYNSRIAVYSPSGSFIFSWGSSGYGHGQFHNPHKIVFQANGTALVADRDNGRIQRFTSDGRYLDEWHSQALGRPWSLSVAGDGTIFCVDGGDQSTIFPRSGVIKFSTEGKLLCRFSAFGSAPGELNEGHSIAASRNGKSVFVVDLNNTRLQKFTSDEADPDSYHVDSHWPVIPTGVSVDPLGVAADGNLVYVSQQTKGKPILVFAADSGSLLRQISSGIFFRAHDISIDTDHTLWVTDVDGNSVYHLSPDGSVLLKIGGN